MFIAGIGSRETPVYICREMEKIGVWCKEHGHIVRSGHADGADYAFEKGALKSCDVFLPWPGFNQALTLLGNPVKITASKEQLDEFVRKFHPSPERLSSGAWSLHGRNACQILGPQLSSPVDAVVCWRIKSGGTDQALRIASSYGIPILNMSLLQFNTASKVIARLEQINSTKSTVK